MLSRTVLCILALLFITSACSKPQVYFPATPSVNQKTTSPEEVVRHKLYSFYSQWKGTPYKIGGLSKQGVDCSGFVYLSFTNLFDRSLPRTTLEQRKLGYKIPRKYLQSGDLLFFKTGWFTHHVGIYLENHLFLHASTSKGVMISSLQEEYWLDSFYIAKRLRLQ